MTVNDLIKQLQAMSEEDREWTVLTPTGDGYGRASTIQLNTVHFKPDRIGEAGHIPWPNETRVEGDGYDLALSLTPVGRDA